MESTQEKKVEELIAQVHRLREEERGLTLFAIAEKLKLHPYKKGQMVEFTHWGKREKGLIHNTDVKRNNFLFSVTILLLTKKGEIHKGRRPIVLSLPEEGKTDYFSPAVDIVVLEEPKEE